MIIGEELVVARRKKERKKERKKTEVGVMKRDRVEFFFDFLARKHSIGGELLKNSCGS